MVETEMELSVGQSSLEVFQGIVTRHKSITHVRVISHNVCLNWRQVNLQSRSKMYNLKQGLIHAIPLKYKWYKREEFLKLDIESLGELGENEVWSVNSKVRLARGQFVYCKHVPMINFHLEDGISAEDMIKVIMGICKDKQGVLLESGRYYHYYGNFLLSHDEWQKFLGQFLMPCIVVSPRYIGHSLNDGYCSLRLTADETFKPKIPRAIKVFK